jgi:hypothetical protein
MDTNKRHKINTKERECEPGAWKYRRLSNYNFANSSAIGSWISPCRSTGSDDSTVPWSE